LYYQIFYIIEKTATILILEFKSKTRYAILKLKNTQNEQFCLWPQATKILRPIALQLCPKRPIMALAASYQNLAANCFEIMPKKCFLAAKRPN